MIKDFETGRGTEAAFLVKEVHHGVAKNGKPFLKALLGDRSGTIDAVCWNVPEESRKLLVEGGAVKLLGTVGTYKGKLQFTIELVSPLGPRDGAMEDLYEVCPRSVEEMARDLVVALNWAQNNILSSSAGTRELIYQLQGWMDIHEDSWPNADRSNEVWSAFKKAPAAMRVHHAYIGGLLEHTVGVVGIAWKISGYYGGLIDPAIVIASAILHDIGKIEEYELSGTITEKGKLSGHIAIGAQLASAELLRRGVDPAVVCLVEHCILSHHGRREWGSPVEPKTAEAYLLHTADLMDVRMWSIAKAREVGEAWQNVKCFGGEVLVAPDKLREEPV